MKCEFCHGRGILPEAMEPCCHCHGIGIVSCCEGAERCANPTPDEELDDAAR
jgi:hypothetical protein